MSPIMIHTTSLLRRILLFCVICGSSYAWNREHIPRRSSLSEKLELTRRAALFTAIQTIPAVSLFSQAARASNLPASTGADTSKVGTVDTLTPIISLRNSLGKIQSKLVNGEKIALDKIIGIPKSEMEFKRLFDEYSDPVSYKQKFLDQNAFLVYYTKGFDGPGRENIEADINERQTQQFGLRNEAWIAFEAFLVELKFIDDDDNDAAKFLSKTIKSLDSYLSLAPQEDVNAAKTSLGVSW